MFAEHNDNEPKCAHIPNNFISPLSLSPRCSCIGGHLQQDYPKPCLLQIGIVLLALQECIEKEIIGINFMKRCFFVGRSTYINHMNHVP